MMMLWLSIVRIALLIVTSWCSPCHVNLFGELSQRRNVKSVCLDVILAGYHAPNNLHIDVSFQPLSMNLRTAVHRARAKPTGIVSNSASTTIEILLESDLYRKT